MLLKDEYSKHNNTLIIDECTAFYVGGSQTLTNSTSNMIMYLMQNDHIVRKLKEEINEVYFNKETFSHDRFNITDLMNLDNI
jgi:cytochrome P450